jgi:hypothetical protein
LGPQSTQHLIQRSRQLQIALGGLTTPHAAPQKQLLITAGPTLCLQDPAEGCIVKSRKQPAGTAALKDSVQDAGKGLIQPWIPGDVPHQLHKTGLSCIWESNAARQNSVSGHEHAAPWPMPIQQI